MSRIVIVQKRIPRYRVNFFQMLRRELTAQGHELRVLVGRPSPSETARRDSGELDWAEPIASHYLLGEKVCLQMIPEDARHADLIVLTHENKLIYNLWLTYVRRPHRVAYWGHGANLQSESQEGLRERFKRRTALVADWWFAYTGMTRELLESIGFPGERISVLNNSIDTGQLATAIASVDPLRQQALREQYGLRGRKVAIYIGSIYRDKRLDFLLDSFDAARRRVPELSLLVVGDGTDRSGIEARIHSIEHAHYVGPAWGDLKAQLLSISDIMLNPGAVGLGILDSFASGRPLITTDCGTHGPEIAYMDSGRNGLMSADHVGAFTEAVVQLASNDALREELGREAAADSRRYTTQAMTAAFVDGINRCLAMPQYRPRAEHAVA